MSKTNQHVTFQGAPLPVIGRVLKEGDIMPSFKLTANDLSDYSSDNLRGKAAIISVVPSLDTSVCSIQTKRFNSEASKLSRDVVVLTVSMDLPFAQARWCSAEDAHNVVTASDYKYRSFGESFGVYIQNLALLSRAVFVIDKNYTVRYLEYVDEITNEPDYEAALKVLKSLV